MSWAPNEHIYNNFWRIMWHELDVRVCITWFIGGEYDRQAILISISCSSECAHADFIWVMRSEVHSVLLVWMHLMSSWVNRGIWSLIYTQRKVWEHNQSYYIDIGVWLPDNWKCMCWVRVFGIRSAGRFHLALDLVPTEATLNSQCG